MRSISHTLHIRQKRQGKERRSPLGRMGIGCSAVASLILLPLIFVVLAGYTSLTKDLPSLEALPSLLNPPDGSLLQPTRIYDRSGTHLILSLQDPGAAGQEYLALETLPQELVDAYLAVFEPSYWNSPGYNLEQVWSSEDQESVDRTIAQRLVSDLLLWDELPSLRRNLRERLLAAQLISHYGHKQVLEWSLNSTQFGPLIYGVDAAARVFFGKSAMTLDINEATFLVAAALSPETSPLEVPQLFIELQKTVLEKMLVHGWITSAELAKSSLTSPTLRDPVPQNNLAPAFINLVLEQLSAYYPVARLQRGGLIVTSSLDYDLQIQSLCTSKVHLARLQGEVRSEVFIDGQPCEAARLLPTIAVDKQATANGLAFQVVMIDPASGQILAMVGESISGLDPAHQPGHPAGSLLTTFIYLAGFTHGLSPASLVWDLPPSQPYETGSLFTNDLSSYHGPLRLRIALANDYLEPARKIVQQLGADTILYLTQELGFDSLKSLVAGRDAMFDQPILLLDVAHAYSIFANQGMLAGQSLGIGENSQQRNNSLPTLQPATLIQLEDLGGRVWLDWTIAQRQTILAPQLAYLMNDVLSDEPSRWLSLGHPNPLEIGRPAGAKLGISSSRTSAWSVGFTPQRLVAIWAGYLHPSPAPESTRLLTSEVPAALWHALMQYAMRGLPSQGWEMPSGISQVAVCDPSGMLPTENCPNVVNEIFLAGSEPVQQDSLYQIFQVNRESGQLATVFTPPEMVEERVYLVIPPDAVEWARKTGIPIPPDSYDPIYVAPNLNTEVRIDSPGMFGHVSGEIEIIGSASGEDFAYYRLQAGQGLNPQTWVLISEDIHTPVTQSVLGEWQTANLSGLYTLELLVVNQDQSVQKAILQVTIDNTPPELSIKQPIEDQKIKLEPGVKVLFQVEASDDLQIARMEFFIDELLVATLIEPPFNILWQGQAGEHRLQVFAYDLAGNLAQKSVSFELIR